MGGPGGQSVFEDLLGDWWIGFDDWKRGEVGYEDDGRRAMYIDRVTFGDEAPETEVPARITGP